MTRNRLCYAILLPFLAVSASAKPKGPAPKKASKETARAIDELQGKFKWAMTVDEVRAMLETEVRKRHDEEWKKAVGDAFAQDRINQTIREESARFAKTYIEFKGQKTPWEVSLIDREFAHGNEESMLVIEEAQRKQRRFLFFYQGKLYKQLIAFDKELFAGKDFDQFAQIIQDRYGHGIAKYTLNRKGEQILEHLEWPPSGSSLLRAVDQSNFYDTFCLVIEDRSVAHIVAPRHKENAQQVGSSALVREIQAPDKVSGDINADIVDRITGRGKGAASSQEPTNLVSEQPKINAPTPVAAPAGAEPTPAKAPAPAKKKKDGKLDDLEL
jgi:hypothetical protein